MLTREGTQELRYRIQKNDAGKRDRQRDREKEGQTRCVSDAAATTAAATASAASPSTDRVPSHHITSAAGEEATLLFLPSFLIGFRRDARERVSEGREEGRKEEDAEEEDLTMATSTNCRRGVT